MKICNFCNSGPCEIDYSLTEHIIEGFGSIIISSVPEIFINEKKYNTGLCLCCSEEQAQSHAMNKIAQIVESGCIR